MVIAAAIDKYVFVAMNRTFTDDYFLKYSAMERVTSRKDIEHPIVREAFEAHEVEPSVEMVSVADIPAGTGLGSSGTFTVGLLRGRSMRTSGTMPLRASWPRRRAASRSIGWGGRWGSRISTSPRSAG